MCVCENMAAATKKIHFNRKTLKNCVLLMLYILLISAFAISKSADYHI